MKAITLRISRRPSSIFTVRTNFPAVGSPAKFPIELTSPKPGPTFPMVAMDAEKAVNRSIPKKERIRVVQKNVKT